MLDQQLRVPGPTPLPARVARAASRPMINHRGPEFAALLEDVVTGLRWALRTGNDVLLYPASGTGGLEAAVVNVLNPGEVSDMGRSTAVHGVEVTIAPA
jgi:aspartate aminotransferase-like enzyme